jgi:hypothetical protein
LCDLSSSLLGAVLSVAVCTYRPGLVHSGPSRAQNAQHIITLERMLLAVILEHLYG